MGIHQMLLRSGAVAPGPAGFAMLIQHGYVNTQTTPPAGVPLAAYNQLAANFSALLDDDMSTLVNLTDDQPLNFGSGLTATTHNTEVRTGTADGEGRYQVIAPVWMMDGRPVNLFQIRITFNQPVAGFGTYITDIADFGGSIWVEVEFDDGTLAQYPVPSGAPSGSNANLAFWGFTVRPGDGKTGVVNIRFFNVNYVYEDPGSRDLVGYAYFAAALPGTLNPTIASYPDPWTDNTWNLVRSHLSELVSANQFASETDYTYGLQDSETDSAAAGTLSVTGGVFGFNCYRNLGGARLTVMNSNDISFNAKLNLAWTFDFFFTRTGARVGNGFIVHWGDNLRISLDATNKLVFTVRLGGVTYTVTSTQTLALDTRYFLRMQKFHLWDGVNFQWDEQFQLFLDGVEACEVYNPFISTDAPPAAARQFATVAPFQLGAENSSNYTPGVFSEFRMSTTLRNHPGQYGDGGSGNPVVHRVPTQPFIN